VYAAEIMCVLIGAKPIGMIQYTSSSDDETVYPLVQELCEHIVRFRVALGDQFPVDYAVYKYTSAQGEDFESLIVYRKEFSSLLGALRPEGDVAQALHILPFPRGHESPIQRKQDLEEQLFLSYWNGKVLGYPDHMIKVYIRDFKTELSQDDKNRMLRKGETGWKRYLDESGLVPVEIKRGLADSVSSDFWESLPSNIAAANAQHVSDTATCQAPPN